MESRIVRCSYEANESLVTNPEYNIQTTRIELEPEEALQISILLNLTTSGVYRNIISSIDVFSR